MRLKRRRRHTRACGCTHVRDRDTRPPHTDRWIEQIFNFNLFVTILINNIVLLSRRRTIIFLYRLWRLGAYYTFVRQVWTVPVRHVTIEHWKNGNSAFSIHFIFFIILWRHCERIHAILRPDNCRYLIYR